MNKVIKVSKLLKGKVKAGSLSPHQYYYRLPFLAVPCSKAVRAIVSCTLADDRVESGHRSSLRCVANLAEEF
jgi:hypothetical protein